MCNWSGFEVALLHSGCIEWSIIPAALTFSIFLSTAKTTSLPHAFFKRVLHLPLLLLLLFFNELKSTFSTSFTELLVYCCYCQIPTILRVCCNGMVQWRFPGSPALDLFLSFPTVCQNLVLVQTHFFVFAQLILKTKLFSRSVARVEYLFLSFCECSSVVGQKKQKQKKEREENERKGRVQCSPTETAARQGWTWDVFHQCLPSVHLHTGEGDWSAWPWTDPGPSLDTYSDVTAALWG